MEHEDDAIIIIVRDENDEKTSKKSSYLPSLKVKEKSDETRTGSTSKALDILGKTVIVNEVVLEETEENYDEEFLSGYQRERYNKLKRKECRRSFVKELREQYPELAEDSDLLICTLAEIMRSIKPPPPPQDHYVMNGVMFECIVCSAIFVKDYEVRVHYQDIHGPKYLSCFSCGLNFRRGSYLYEHEKRCQGNAMDVEVVLRARAIAVGNRGRSRPYLMDAKKFRRAPESRRKSRAKQGEFSKRKKIPKEKPLN